MPSSPAVLAAIAVGILLLGVVLGWLWRGALCRRRHGTGRYEQGGIGTFFHGAAADVPPGDYPESASPLPDGASPHPEFVVKAKTSSLIYHAPGMPTYPRTVADVWFRTADDAEAAGFRAPRSRSRSAG